MSVPQAIERRRRLMNPDNAVPDRPIEMRNGAIVPPPMPEAPKKVLEQPDPWKEFFNRCHQLAVQGEDRPIRRTISVNEVLRIVAQHYGLTVNDLISHRRTMRVVRPRQVVCWICKERTPYSLPYIGARIGGRDHTTVLHSIRVVDRLREIDPELQADLDKLLSALRPNETQGDDDAEATPSPSP